MSITKSQSSVSLLAKSIITRLEASADKLAIQVTFKCSECKDTRLIEKNGRYKQCSNASHNKETDATSTGKFF
jgi:alpha-D-ribose 1-methylphosphonate 5-triphosphate synthase subunit PhnG